MTDAAAILELKPATLRALTGAHRATVAKWRRTAQGRAGGYPVPTHALALALAWRELDEAARARLLEALDGAA